VAQGVKHLNVLSFYGPTDKSLTGQLVRCLWEEALLTVGVGSNMLTWVFTDYGHLLEPGWIKTVWKFSHEYGVQVEDWLPSVPLLRENDRYLVQAAKEVIRAKDRSSLKSFNKCRLFLKVVSLADITHGNGRSVIQGIVDGRPLKWNPRRDLKIRPSYPNSADWTVWRSVLSRMFPLQQPLGKWYSHIPGLCFMSALETELFLKQQLGWSRHCLVSGNRASRSKRFTTQGHPIDDLPYGVRGTMVYDRVNGYECWGSSDTIQITNSPGPSEGYNMYSEGFGLGRQFFPDPAVVLTICSDGSFKQDRGTASWIAVSADMETGEDLVVPTGSHNSYRSELAGILGGLRFLDSVNIQFLPTNVRFVCDGLSALEMAFGVFPIQMSTAEYDILKEIRRYRASLVAKGARISPIHVRGHADNRVQEDELTSDEKLNIRMDERAKAFWSKMQTIGWQSSGLASSCLVRVENKVVVNSSLPKLIHEAALKEFWTRKKGIQSSSQVDWASFAKATRSMRRGKGVFMTKFFSGYCGVNRWRKIWGLVSSENCPRCEAEAETTSHLWTCRDAAACTLREGHVDELIRWIQLNGGNSRFSLSVRSVLGAIRNNTATIGLHSIPEEYQDVVAAQAIIGWDNFLMGCWSIQWQHSLRAEYEAMDSPRQPERTIAEIIAKLWEISWDLWLGRNAAVYPNQEISAEGEVVPRVIRPTSLCRPVRRRRLDSVGRSRAFMMRWLSGG
jgi:hypothetical protein